MAARTRHQSPDPEARWRELVGQVLAGRGQHPRDPVAALTTRTDDGVPIAPLYTAAAARPTGLPGEFPYTRGRAPAGSSRVGPRLVSPVSDDAPVLPELLGGANGVWLRTDRPIADALAGVDPAGAVIALDPGERYPQQAADLAEFAAGCARPAGINLGADPLGVQLRTGDFQSLVAAVRLARSLGGRPGVSALVADGLPYHCLGAGDADEIATVTATALGYLRAADEPVGIDVRFAATADQFGTICKLRAARAVWARMCEVIGIPGNGARQHAVTSPIMMTRRDPWTNLLRTTVACFAAIAGDADWVTVLPYDGGGSDLGRRIARNTGTVLVEESAVGLVADPAGGSYYVESRTDAVARAAWSRFTEIDRRGGIAAALADGWLRSDIAATRDARNRRVAERAEEIVGASVYPDFGTTPPPTSIGWEGRLAEPYEALADAADAADLRPTVLLVTSATTPRARLTFTVNALHAGGIDVVERRLDDALGALADFPVVAVCDRDDDYPAHLAALRDAGARHLVAVTTCDVSADARLYDGVNLLDLLRRLQRWAGTS